MKCEILYKTHLWVCQSVTRDKRFRIAGEGSLSIKQCQSIDRQQIKSLPGSSRYVISDLIVPCSIPEEEWSTLHRIQHNMNWKTAVINSLWCRDESQLCLLSSVTWWSWELQYRLLTIKGRGVMSTPVFGAEETGCHEIKKKKFFMECKILKQQQQQKHPRCLHYIQLGVLTTTLVYLKQATFAQICKLVSCICIYARNLSPLRAVLF